MISFRSCARKLVRPDDHHQAGYFDPRRLFLRKSSISRMSFRPALVLPFVLSGSDSNSALIWSDMALSAAYRSSPSFLRPVSSPSFSAKKTLSRYLFGENNQGWHRIRNSGAPHQGPCAYPMRRTTWDQPARRLRGPPPQSPDRWTHHAGEDRNGADESARFIAGDAARSARREMKFADQSLLLLLSTGMNIS